jgi:BolA protein
MTSRIDRIRTTLEAALQPTRLQIEDDSAQHAGHAGARKGGHYRVVIVSAAFDGHALVGRHRMVYEALAELLRTDVHAVSIRALTPEEDSR